MEKNLDRGVDVGACRALGAAAQSCGVLSLQRQSFTGLGRRKSGLRAAVHRERCDRTGDEFGLHERSRLVNNS